MPNYAWLPTAAIANGPPIYKHFYSFLERSINTSAGIYENLVML